MISAPGYFHLHLISDSTGETLITVARAAAAQYSRIMPVEHVHPLVGTQGLVSSKDKPAGVRLRDRGRLFARQQGGNRRRLLGDRVRLKGALVKIGRA